MSSSGLLITVLKPLICRRHLALPDELLDVDSLGENLCWGVKTSDIMAHCLKDSDSPPAGC